MNWKTYSKLTAEQKEEWTFKYSKKEYPVFPINTVVFMYLTFIVAMCLMILISKEYIQVSFDVLALFIYAGKVMKWILLISVFEHLCYTLYFGWQCFDEARWIKRLTKK